MREKLLDISITMVYLVYSVPKVCEHFSVSATAQKESTDDISCELSHSTVVSRSSNISSSSYVSSSP
jgi:hypothetical protein